MAGNYDTLCFHEKLTLFVFWEAKEAKRKKKPYAEDGNIEELGWTPVVISTLYCQPCAQVGYSEKLKQIREHSRNVRWKDIYARRLEYMALDKNFLYAFYDLIDWPELLQESSDLMDSELLDFMVANELVGWDEISSAHNLPIDFLEKYNEHINWDIFIKENNIPVELRDLDNIIKAIKQNPDLINIKNNKSIAAEMTSKLKRYTWIDRMPASETNYHDDTGNWVDTAESQAEDESLIAAVEPDEVLYDMDDIEL